MGRGRCEEAEPFGDPENPALKQVE
jgi:hypothetical protein